MRTYKANICIIEGAGMYVLYNVYLLYKASQSVGIFLR